MKSRSKAGEGHARPSDDESIEATAAAWLAQRDNVMTADDELALASWRAADPRHEAAFARLERAWVTLQSLRNFRPEAARHPDRDILARPAGGRVLAFPARIISIAAAAAVFVLVAGWWVVRSGKDRTEAITYVTSVGGFQRVLLPDRSVLELNGDTAAEVRFTVAERRVRLARGEAHFSVAKNPARPFWVEAGGIAVRAVGTAFNVRVGFREVEVLVTEGKVSVTEPIGPALAGAPLSSTPAGREPARIRGIPEFLGANERVRIATVSPAQVGYAAPAAEPLVERISPEAVREALAWQGPRLVFVDTPLAEVVAQFNRANAVQLELADPALAALPIGGSFRPDNFEAAVRLLESGGEVVVDRSNPAHLVLRRAK